MSNYPAGVTDKTIDEYFGSPKPKEVEVLVSYTISKEVTVETDDYIVENWMDSECDEDGYIVTTGGTDYDYSNCDLKKDYEECEYTLPELKKEFENLLNNAIKYCSTNNNDIKKYKAILKALQGWTIDEFEVVLN